MANILESATKLLQDGIAGEPPPPANLLAISDRLNELSSVSVDPSGEGIARWLDKLHAIAADAALRETLVVRALQMRFPRLAEALTLAGVIRYAWAGDAPSALRIDWTQLEALMTKPGDAALTSLLSKVQNLEDLHALQVLGLMLVAAPQALLALEYRGQGFAGLPLGGVPGVNSDEIRQLIDELIQSPLRLPLPVALPLTLTAFRQTAGRDADGPLGSITLDAPAALNQLDGLALAIHLKQAESVKQKRIDLGNGWQITFDGHDGGDKSYRLQFNAAGLDPAVRPAGDLAILVGKQPAGAG